MASVRVSDARVRPPRGWLFLAFLGVWLYLVSQLLRLVPERVADFALIPIADAKVILTIISGLGQVLLFAGLVAALWRATLTVGLSAASVRGLALGAGGVGILSLFEVSLLADWIGIPSSPVTALAQSPAIDAGFVVGSALAFAGLASFGVGLARMTTRFDRAAPTRGEAGRTREETG